MLNIGAGRSLLVERQLSHAGCNYVSDRVDIDDCVVDFPSVRKCWQCSVEDMNLLDSSRYSVAVANYVLEHVDDLHSAAREVYRVTVPGGVFIATVPNTAAPEMILARHTPLWFHKMIRRGNAWETKYAYKQISELLDIFRRAGFQVDVVRYWPFVEGYLHQFPIVGKLGWLYDKVVAALDAKWLMANVCVVLRKPA